MPQTADEINRERIKEAIDYLQMGWKVHSRDFETIQNIGDENQKELIKAIVDPLDVQINDKISKSDYKRN